MRRLISVCIGLSLIPGCGLIRLLTGNQTQETGSAKLIPFTSEKELRDYFAGQVQSRNSSYSEMALGREDMAAPTDGAPPNSATPDADGAAGGDTQGESADDFSGTTIQEEGVDEADIVKNDATHIYILTGQWDHPVVRIVRAAPMAEMVQVAEVTLEGRGREMYLLDDDDKIVALSETGGGYFYMDPLPSDIDGGVAAPDFIGGSYVYERPRTAVTIIDVSAPDHPQVESTTKFDGTASSSRMIGGVLHLVLSNYPDYYFDVMPMLGRPEMDASGITVSDVLPTYHREDADGSESEGVVVEYDDMFRPTDPDGFGVVTVVSLDVNDDAAFTSVGVVAAPGLIYSSLNALYLTDTQWDFLGETRETTDLYKFEYVERSARAAATGTVPGRVLNQYSMSEHQGFLRVATTVGPNWGFFGPITESANNVYVLEPSGDELVTIGKKEDIAPGETIQACRFVGNRGFLVTFEQIDPLFTIDLTDPTRPEVIGELKVPGFSTFLMPIDETHLLAVGQYIPENNPWVRGVEMSIFDVTDFSNPQRTAHVFFGDEGSAYSEALYNPKALTFFRSQGLVALPVSVYNYGPIVVDEPTMVEGGSGGGADGVIVGDSTQASDGSDGAPPPGETTEPEPAQDDAAVTEPEGFDAVVVFRVSAADGFTELGRISTRFDQNAYYYGGGNARGVFIGGDVFAATDAGVRGVPVADMAAVPVELAFPVSDPPVVIGDDTVVSPER